jgi:hypothetical protein
MTVVPAGLVDELERAGFVILRGAFAATQADAILAELSAALVRASRTEPALVGPAGGIYAARNVLSLWPAAADVWRSSLRRPLGEVLGRGFGLVRALYFDKPPDQTWALPWHKDLTIAVRANRLPGERFRKPTVKAGVPHVEAPVEVLRAMLTARIHLDDVTEENGPLKVIPGSHRSGKALELGESPPRSILVQRGDVLLMRPLLAHCSNRSHPDTRRHRRILHLEFAAGAELPDGYAWHTFLPA